MAFALGDQHTGMHIPYLNLTRLNEQGWVARWWTTVVDSDPIGGQALLLFEDFCTDFCDARARLARARGAALVPHELLRVTMAHALPDNMQPPAPVVLCRDSYAHATHMARHARCRCCDLLRSSGVLPWLISKVQQHRVLQRRGIERCAARPYGRR